MRGLLSQLLAVGPELAAFILTSPLLAPPRSFAAAQATVPSPDLDLSQLGRVAVAGDFDSISLFASQGQTENTFVSNGSQAVLTQDADGTFRQLEMADANINAMCPFIHAGKLMGVILGGNFTSLGGVEAPSAATWNPSNNAITPLQGLSGPVNAVFCDAESGIAYFGGSFMAGNISTNAMAWTTNWTNLPFAGFNGPVNTITKNSAGNIVFGGNFDGLGNATTPNLPDVQAVNLASGDVVANGSTTRAGFSDPRNIICQTGADEGPGNTWLLADNSQGFWQSTFRFGFNPTKLRLYNTNFEGRGTKTFYFQNLNSMGIPNLNFVDVDGNNASCSSVCPLPQGNTTFQDFFFVPSVGMDSFKIQITDWYGDGGGLAGIEMFQNDIYSFAIGDFNEAKCDGVSNGSSSALTPASLWGQTKNNGTTTSDYVYAFLDSASDVAPNVSVVFTPDIRQSGNYSITVYTPGCQPDGTCATRGEVNITGTVTTNGPPISSTLAQTNDFDKNDQVYFGFVDLDSGSFKPSVTLTPALGQAVPLTVVAQRVRFELISTTGGLNGLFEFNPNEVTVSTDFSKSSIDAAGAKLQPGAVVNVVESFQDKIFVGGNFTADGIANVMSVGDSATALPGGGLDAPVQAMYLNGSMLYMAGNFSSSADGSVKDVNNVVAFDIANDKWVALGAGVNGPVVSLVNITLNVTNGNEENCLSMSGSFTSVNAFGGNDAFSAAGFAVWVPSQNNWLQNIPSSDVSISGRLSAMTEVPGSSPVFAGQITSQGLDFSGVSELVGSGQPSLQSLGVKIQSPGSGASSSSMRKRAIDTSHNFTGVYAGLFYDDNGLNITVLGGLFSAHASNGSTVDNLIFINNTDSTQTVTGVSGIDSDSIFAAMDTHDTTLYAGGRISGSINGNTINGLIAYDLQAGAVASPQPPALMGDNVIVNAITAQPGGSNDIYVGGDFAAAGSLPCQTLCFYDTVAQQWNIPGSGLSGVISTMFWSSNTDLIIAGNLTIGGNQTMVATYDSKKQTFTQVSAASPPGAITVLTPANTKDTEFWAAGTATNNGSTFLSRFSDDTWTSVGGIGPGSTIRGLQIIALTSNHDSTDLVDSDEVLMIVGNINLPSFGNASAVLFNGTTFTPFLLSNKDGGDDPQGSLASIFVSNRQNLMKLGHGSLAVGFIVLIGLAIALGLIFLIVVAGILVERHRRRREGYRPMNSDRNGNVSRIPPETLLQGLQEKGAPPKL